MFNRTKVMIKNMSLLCYKQASLHQTWATLASILTTFYTLVVSNPFIGGSQMSQGIKYKKRHVKIFNRTEVMAENMNFKQLPCIDRHVMLTACFPCSLVSGR